VDDPGKVGEAWDEALAAGGPVLLEVKTDPEVPPLSPHISFEQTRHFAEALVKDKPHREGVIASTARQVLSAILTGKRPASVIPHRSRGRSRHLKRSHRMPKTDEPLPWRGMLGCAIATIVGAAAF